MRRTARTRSLDVRLAQPPGHLPNVGDLDASQAKLRGRVARAHVFGEDEAMGDMLTLYPYWYTAEEIVRSTRRGLEESQGEALRWMVEGVNLLKDAEKHHDLERCLVEPEASIDIRWDTLIAATIRYRLRVMGIHAPQWTFKEPLETMWFISGVLPSKVATAINLAPPELARVGIYLPEPALQ